MTACMHPTDSGERCGFCIGCERARLAATSSANTALKFPKLMRGTKFVTGAVRDGQVLVNKEHRSEKAAHAYCVWVRNLNPKRYGHYTVTAVPASSSDRSA